MSQRVFAKLGEPQHVGKHVPTPQPARLWPGVALRQWEKQGDGAGGAGGTGGTGGAGGAALPPHQALVTNNPGGKEEQREVGMCYFTPIGI